ncbi:otu domain-containing protein 3 [Phtheirospermum japonicum]|uniref:Otu domain-containing protein 3 n=1 Tax=Phtheirospermum japonicum TaxID=374723 RepID=A0A830BZL1_9LAMI|nr:otu domain-containing protein 3 [Phtheirospermum japonicum]
MVLQMNLNTLNSVRTRHANWIHLAMMRKQVTKRTAHNMMTRKFQETKPAHVAQRRSISLAVVQFPENLQPDSQLTKQLTMGRAGKTESKVEKLAQRLRVPFKPMVGHPTWVRYASSGIFEGHRLSELVMHLL